MTKNCLAQLPSTSIWLTAQIPVGFSEKWQWHNDITYKTLGIDTRAYQKFYRTGIRYMISKKWNTAGGFGFFSTNVSTDKHVDEFGREFRLWQEINYQHGNKKILSVQHRFRTEDRFFKATDTKPSFFILNLTYRLSVTKPVSKKWDILLADEFFEQYASHQFVFNQNRAIAGSSYNISKTAQLQSAYIWVLRKSVSIHVLQLTYKKLILVYGKKEQKKKSAIPHLPEAE